MSIIIESAIEKHVINTYLKMPIPIRWKKIFEKIAEIRNYLYNHCNNRFYKFDRYCADGYMYNVIKNGSVTIVDYVCLNNFNYQNVFLYME